ncbi:hypothetical protein AV530_010883 [Patagioenas fasciata monilis]|uniref:Uncharacterized protein n=1 Tax=Patagioenas fasciata monilis TaxID=372326 RepID=A0A1V4K8C4_PATFA|nr:hypothetical protein AV530_010883 [Patagioenas fasciata monilis]
MMVHLARSKDWPVVSYPWDGSQIHLDIKLEIGSNSLVISSGMPKPGIMVKDCGGFSKRGILLWCVERIGFCNRKCRQYTGGERHKEWEKFQLTLTSNGKTIAKALRQMSKGIMNAIPSTSKVSLIVQVVGTLEENVFNVQTCYAIGKATIYYSQTQPWTQSSPDCVGVLAQTSLPTEELLSANTCKPEKAS